MTRHLRHCRLDLIRDTGRAPRTCARCGLGPCQEGHVEGNRIMPGELANPPEAVAAQPSVTTDPYMLDGHGGPGMTMAEIVAAEGGMPEEIERVPTRVEIPTVYVAAIVKGHAATILSAHYSERGAADACFDSEDRNNAQVFMLELKP